MTINCTPFRPADDWVPADIPEADAYHADRGNDDWTGDDTEKQFALNRAWDFIRTLNFNPSVAFYCDIIPPDVKSAHIEAALEELRSPGAMQPTTSKDDYLVKKDLAGVIIKEWERGSPPGTKFAKIDGLLVPFLRSSSGDHYLIRG